MKLFNYTNIDDAYNRIKDLVLKTPLISNENINNLTGAKVFFKFENFSNSEYFIRFKVILSL